MLSDLMNLQSGMEQLRAYRSLNRERELEIQQKQRDLDDDDDIRSTITRFVPQGGDGEPDWDGVLNDLHSRGRGTAALRLQDKIIDVRKKQVDTLKSQLDNTQTTLKLASNIAQSITDQDSFSRAVPQIGKLLGTNVASMFGSQYDPKVIEQLVAQGMSASDLMQKQKNAFDQAQKVLDNTRNALKDDRDWAEKQPKLHDDWTKVGSNYLSLATNQQDWEQGLSMLRQGMSMLPPEFREGVATQFGDQFSKEAVQKARLLGMTQGQRSQEMMERGRQALDAQRLSLEDAIPNLTPEALDMVANQFAMTGQMVPMGMGKQATGMRTKIYNRAAEIYSGLNLADQAAAFKANQAALTRLTQQAAAIEAFESTAVKNLQVMIEQAKNIVDTGSPLLNRPLRTIDEKALGSPQMAAFNTARRVVVPEFARIIANPNLTGVLSNQARNEIDELMRGDATMNQILATSRILMRDANNRKTALKDEIDAIRKRIATPPAGSVRAPGSSSGVPPNFNGEIEQGGQKFWIKTDAAGNVTERRRIVNGVIQ